MDWRDWLRTVLSVSVLLGIAEMLLPPGNMAKFSKLVLGLVLMLAILQPISNLLNPNVLTAGLHWLDDVGLAEPNVNPTAAKMQLAGVESILGASGRGLAEQIEDLLLAETALTNTRVEVGLRFGNKVAIVMIEPYNQQLCTEVKNIVGAILSFDPEQIDVQELGM